MIFGQDILFIEKASMNEGLTSVTLSKVALYFTKDYLFVIPYDSNQLWESTQTSFKDAEEFIKDLNNIVDTISINDFQNLCINFLPNGRIYKIENLEKFMVRSGFAFFGGLTLKKRGEQLQTIKINKRSSLTEIKKFYKD